MIMEDTEQVIKTPAPFSTEMRKTQMIDWRHQTAVTRVDHPTNPKKAKMYGYKAKQGYVVARVKIGKGASKRDRPSGGRRPASSGQTKYTPKQSQQWISEQRASRQFPGMEVLGSYYVGEDGQRVWYEIILTQPSNIQGKGRGRVWRGITPAGRTSRGLRHKGKGAEKLRPSKQATIRKRAKTRGSKGRRQRYFPRKKIAKK